MSGTEVVPSSPNELGRILVTVLSCRESTSSWVKVGRGRNLSCTLLTPRPATYQDQGDTKLEFHGV